MKNLTIFFLLIFICLPLSAQSPEKALTKSVFETLVEDWKQEIQNDFRVSVSSSLEPYMKLKSFQKLMDYKAQVIPFFVEDMPKVGRGLEGACFKSAVKKISKKRFEDEIRWEIMKREKTLFYTYIDWWENGEEQDIETFNALYASYQQSSKPEEKQELLTKIKHLGIRLLPKVMEKINQGDENFIPVIDHLTDGEFNKRFKDQPGMSNKEKVQRWWQADKERWLVKPTNKN